MSSFELPELWIYVLIFLVTAIVLWLIKIIYGQWKSLKRLKRNQAEQLQLAERTKKEKERYIIDSITLIAQGVEDNQLGKIEAAIRLKVLVDNLQPDFSLCQELKILTFIYDSTLHIPRLQAWRALAEEDKSRFAEFMQGLEVKHASEIQASVQYLLSHPLIKNR
ncbi:DUF2489 domain-containing protein [Nitrincola tapanii]|uniref:DUF2489 domain-containing protein n=1 Tax=Nitrincola tapanii TaxID=1708751 RepID=A0A5A9W3A1_9GAMM|nr:DUF2489 domain-containing protein [Nitrincola tapanii]KAA0874598.1 DUF2489 domain-containing protein [Nitrincola tapanii]